MPTFKYSKSFQEPPGIKYDPRPKDLDTRLLRIQMGKNFDPEFMSIRKPYEISTSPNGTVRFPFKRNRKGRLVPKGNVGHYAFGLLEIMGYCILVLTLNH